jgi:hypothetical protein
MPYWFGLVISLSVFISMATIIIFEGNVKGRKHKYHLVLTASINKSNFIIMSLSIQSNQFSLGTLGLIDADTQEQVSATFSNQSFSGTNDSSFTVAPDADPNTAKVTGVAEGSGQVNFSAHVSYTDKNGQSKEKDLSGTVDVSITAVLVDQNVSLVVNFAPPQNQ